MIKTRFTEKLGLKYPVMQGGMQHLGVADFASVVSECGALGTINISCFKTPEEFEAEVDKMQKLTSKPFAVNFSFLPEMSTDDQERINRMVEICVMKKIAMVETAGGDPSPYLPAFHKAGILVMHKAPTVKIAKRMAEKRADMVSIIGYEVAGHPSMDGIGTMVMANKTAAELDVPVLAAGGFADGKGLAAALSLGCEGIVMGTRFVATKECTISDAHKQWIVEHGERDSMLIMKSIRNMVRAANNEAARKCLELEKQGAGLKELMPVISGVKGKESYMNGNVDGGIFCVGPAMGLIHEVKPVAELLADIEKEAEAVIRRLNGLITDGE